VNRLCRWWGTGGRWRRRSCGRRRLGLPTVTQAGQILRELEQFDITRAATSCTSSIELSRSRHQGSAARSVALALARGGTAGPLVQQRAASAATPCSLLLLPAAAVPSSAQDDRHAAPQQQTLLHLPTALPFHLLLSLSCLAALSIASRSACLCVYSFPLSALYYIFGPWGTGGFTAARSRSNSLQCLCSLRPS